MVAIVLLFGVAWVLAVIAISIGLCWVIDKMIEKVFNL